MCNWIIFQWILKSSSGDPRKFGAFNVIPINLARPLRISIEARKAF